MKEASKPFAWLILEMWLGKSQIKQDDYVPLDKLPGSRQPSLPEKEETWARDIYG